MNPDELKETWQAQLTGRRLTLDAEVVLRHVERSKKDFEGMIFWRDVREVGVALLLVPLWIFLGRKYALPWTWYLAIPTFLWVAGFMVVDRVRQKRRQPKPGDPLRECIESSLAQVDHQIWLLRNVFWWYLLPPSFAVAIFFGQCFWLARAAGGVVLFILARAVGVAALIDWGVYLLNQWSVKKQLEPRRQELEGLLQSLNNTVDAASLPHHPNRSGKIPLPRSNTGLDAQSTVPPSIGGTPAKRVKSGNALWIVWLCLATVGACLVAYRLWISPAVAFNEKFCPAAGDAAVTDLLVPIRQKHRLPAMAAAVVTSKGLVAVGVVGTRKQGTEVAVTLDDQWHLGSDTKAMTATLVARLVEQGRLTWDTTLAEVFPELALQFHPDLRAVTVRQLLTHRSGLSPNPNLIVYGGADGRKERRRVLENVLRQRPAHPPGSHYEYSNLGYSIVGAITEKITGKPWEQAMQEEVFGPLGMTSAGFGGTGTPGQIDQPWPHTRDGRPAPRNGPGMDNPPVLDPAGRVHCTIQDWARFVTDHLRGARGESALLKPVSYVILHTPPAGGEYALGWLVVQRAWGGGTVLNHGGDNTMNFANVWVAPRRDFAVLVCVNQGGDTAFTASDEAIGTLIDRHTRGMPATH